jgi:hypothetical protein
LVSLERTPPSLRPAVRRPGWTCSPASPSSIGSLTPSSPRGSLHMVAAHALVLCAYFCKLRGMG